MDSPNFHDVKYQSTKSSLNVSTFEVGSTLLFFKAMHTTWWGVLASDRPFVCMSFFHRRDKILFSVRMAHEALFDNIVFIGISRLFLHWKLCLLGSIRKYHYLQNRAVTGIICFKFFGKTEKNFQLVSQNPHLCCRFLLELPPQLVISTTRVRTKKL